MKIKYEAYIIGLLYLVVIISAIYITTPDIKIPYWKSITFFCVVYLIGGLLAKAILKDADP